MTPTLTPLDILIKGREIIARPGWWTKHAMARKGTSKGMGYSSLTNKVEEVCRVCCNGALAMASALLQPDTPQLIGYHFTEDSLVKKASCLLSEQTGLLPEHSVYGRSCGGIVATYNDALNATQEKCVALFDRAIVANQKPEL